MSTSNAPWIAAPSAGKVKGGVIVHVAVKLNGGAYVIDEVNQDNRRCSSFDLLRKLVSGHDFVSIRPRNDFEPSLCGDSIALGLGHERNFELPQTFDFRKSIEAADKLASQVHEWNGVLLGLCGERGKLRFVFRLLEVDPIEVDFVPL